MNNEKCCVCPVERLLSMCGSSCLPGGGSNTELALHCLHYCQGNTVVRRHLLFFPLLVPSACIHCILLVIHYFSLTHLCHPSSFFISFHSGHPGDAAFLTALTSRKLPLLWQALTSLLLLAVLCVLKNDS